jgi:GNAT superfamily N-acetyltransferase
MELRLLNRERLSALYREEMAFDFPKSELKPLAAILRLVDLGCYHPLAAVEGEEVLGYAMVWLPPERDRGALLEYLGVLRGKRGAGLGGQMLDLLAARYGALFGEAESPTAQDEAENALRRRRLDFYRRSGFRVLDYQCALFGVRFCCLYRGPEGDDRRVEALHRSVYAGYFSPEHMERFIQLPLRPGEDIHPAPEWTEE